MIFYLSGTGNSKWAANVLAKETGDRTISVVETVDGDCCFTLAEGERVGFVFPVHGWRPPKFMRFFLDYLIILNAQGHYCYALVTAGDNIGETIDILERDLAKRNIPLDAAFSLIMPESYVGLPFMDVDTPEKEKSKKEDSAKRLSVYAQAIKKRVKTKSGLDTGRWPRINSRIIGGLFTRFLVSDQKFYINPDKCIRCGLCADVCPVSNIYKVKGRIPGWKYTGKCMTCFSCYHHCPTHAIEFGRMTKKKGQYYFDKNK